MINTKDPALIKAFGDRIRSLRKEKKLSMEKLAELSDIDYRQLSYVELGEVNTTISTASAIAKGLDIPLRELFDF
ncbi:helix-turn-helix transcriptional regulator [Daejeonella sp. JGW-45]|uniref:helix-turn-helix domain-containing protein n=1 Tax=Daejeonella sp. JGW-45 TaxID=3034148 RepID=UPI0023ED237D|nr:helix-turn-helix transcriptional regulator [Daejeonella sp. JGW-45]